MTSFIDTNILVKVLDEQDHLHGWSLGQLNYCKQNGPAVIIDIVFCELSVGMKSLEEVTAVIDRLALDRVPLSDAALFRAGKAFRKYKDENKGPKPGVLPDFFIGAMAAASGVALITANPSDYVKYLPELQVISP